MKLKSLLTILLLLIYVVGFAQTTRKIIKGKGYKGVILSMDTKLRSDLDSLQRWMPTENDIDELESLLPAHIKEITFPKNKKRGIDPFVKKNLTRYFRQYAGYINNQGEKLIFVSCIFDFERDKDSFYKNWDKELITVFDGGSEFWRVIII